MSVSYSLKMIHMNAITLSIDTAKKSFHSEITSLETDESCVIKGTRRII